ncbi:MAG: ABC transporter substrate-binding protein [Candidatus Sumerlaeota bacterium]|nr:ABC transporter substrate-binding protein [Candidatus Sumerlaeota bacterium]
MNRRLTLGHSPDPDDAFMFYALAKGLVDAQGWQFEHILQDIQTLNERAMRCELDISAVSIHAYAYVAEDYALLSCGASMGDNYGPLVVAREPMEPGKLASAVIAVPGTMTTAFLALKLAIGEFRYEVMPFDQILDAVVSGRASAGLIIHEGQLTYRRGNLCKVIDLGEWWNGQHALPLPLGGNVIRRALGDEAIKQISAILRQSIEYGLTHRHEAVEYALQWARDMGHDLADRFVGMYVNDLTLDYGERGRRAIELLFELAAQRGIIPRKPELEKRR